MYIKVFGQAEGDGFILLHFVQHIDKLRKYLLFRLIVKFETKLNNNINHKWIGKPDQKRKWAFSTNLIVYNIV